MPLKSLIVITILAFVVISVDLSDNQVVDCDAFPCSANVVYPDLFVGETTTLTYTTTFNLNCGCRNPRLTVTYLDNDLGDVHEWISIHEGSTVSDPQIGPNCVGVDEDCDIKTCFTDAPLISPTYIGSIDITAFTPLGVDGVHHDGVRDVCASADGVDTSGGNVIEATLILSCDEMDTYFSGDEIMNWYDANVWCQDQGTTLASVHNDAAFDETGDVCRTQIESLGASIGCWIGLIDETTESYWVWSDGTANDYGVEDPLGFVTVGAGPGAASGDGPWNAGEPNNCCSGEDCTHIFLSGDREYWNDIHCGGIDFYPICNPIPGCSAECAESDVFTFDWDELTTHGIADPADPARSVPQHVVELFDVDKPSLTLNIIVKVEYVIESSADDRDGHEWGVTYVLDFEDFDAHKDGIGSAGTCENRKSSDFGVSFNEQWSHTMDISDIGTLNNRQYPPPGDRWTITDKDCHWVTYSGSFTWEDLRSCNNHDSSLEPYTTITDTGSTLDLEGVFYINVVSPFWYDTEFNYYRVYQILSQPFIISVNKRVDVLSGAGINVITVSIIAVYKEGDQRGDSDPNTKIGENIFRLIVLTEAAEYMYLSDMVLNSFTGATPAALLIGTGVGTGNLNAVSTAVTSTDPDRCLNNKLFLCSQLWEINAHDIKCDAGAFGTDFSGNYVLTFNTNCGDTDPLSHCMTWLGAHPSISPTVTVSADLTWVDNVCNTEVFTVEFPGSMDFYTDNTFSLPALAGPGHLFEVGVDTIYVEVTITYPPDTFDVFNAILRDVWICTTAPSDLDDPLGLVTELRDDPLAEVGCLSPDRDDAFDGAFHHIYDGDDAADIHEFDRITASDTNVVRFSFKVPHSVERDTLWVHTRIEVELQELPGRRRRMLLRGSRARGANQIGMNIEQTGVTRDPNYIKPKQPEKEPQKPYQPYPQEPIQPQSPNDTFYLSLSSPWVMAIGGLLGLILTFNIIMMCYMNCNKEQRGRVSFSSNKRNGYNKVKRADSEFDESEVNAINIVSE